VDCYGKLVSNLVCLYVTARCFSAISAVAESSYNRFHLRWRAIAIAAHRRCKRPPAHFKQLCVRLCVLRWCCVSRRSVTLCEYVDASSRPSPTLRVSTGFTSGRRKRSSPSVAGSLAKLNFYRSVWCCTEMLCCEEDGEGTWKLEGMSKN